MRLYLRLVQAALGAFLAGSIALALVLLMPFLYVLVWVFWLPGKLLR